MTFEEWLTASQERRDFLAFYGKTGRPGSAEARALDSNAALEYSHEAGELLNVASSFLAQAKSMAMFQVKQNHPELNSRERELVERAEVSPIQLIVDGCEVTHKSCVSRYFNYKGR